MNICWHWRLNTLNAELKKYFAAIIFLEIWTIIWEANRKLRGYFQIQNYEESSNVHSEPFDAHFKQCEPFDF